MMSRRAKVKGYSVGVSGQSLETAPRQGENSIMMEERVPFFARIPAL